MKRVLILGITNLSNLGDNLISECTDYLVRQEFPNCEIIHKDLFIRWKELKGLSRIVAFILTSVKVLAEKGRWYCLAELAFSILHTKYYNKLIRHSDYVIMTSGMLKYTTQSHAYVYSLLCKVAEKEHRPTLLNAKSIQRGNMSDVRYRHLRKALHRDYVSINTRDGIDGVQLLINDYGITVTSFVGDPALWAREAYDIKLKRTTDEKVVGVNLIRPNIYLSYGQNNSVKSIVDLYNNLLNELTSRGYKWKLFCNGMKDDYDLYTQLSNVGNHNVKPVFPSTTQDLLQTIASFGCVIGFRLHACIASVALDVPVVGMIWDDKARYFAKSMGMEHFFVEPEELRAATIVDLVEEQMKGPLCYSNKDILKLRCRKAISDFLSKQSI